MMDIIDINMINQADSGCAYASGFCDYRKKAMIEKVI